MKDSQVHFADEDSETLCGIDKEQVEYSEDLEKVTCEECLTHHVEFTVFLENMKSKSFAEKYYEEVNKLKPEDFKNFKKGE